MILDPDDYRFTFSEVVGESPEAATNLRNWMARGILPVGQKHKLGRWLFSLADIIRIRVVRSLLALASMPPAEANRLADEVIARYRSLVTPDERGRAPLLYMLKPNTLSGRQRLCLSELYGPLLGTVNSHGVLEFDLPDRGDTKRKVTFDELMGNSPHLVIPMDEMIAKAVMNFTLMAVEEAGDEWVDHDLAVSRDGKFDPYAEAITVEGFIDWYARHSHHTGRTRRQAHD